MMIFSFSAALTMGNGISVSADHNAEENIPDDVILQTEQSQEEADFFSNNSEIGDFSSGSADSNAESANTNDSENSDEIIQITVIQMVEILTTIRATVTKVTIITIVIMKTIIRMVMVTPALT